MDNDQLRTLARLGAQARLAAIEQERAALLALSPRPGAPYHRSESNLPASQGRLASAGR